MKPTAAESYARAFFAGLRKANAKPAPVVERRLEAAHLLAHMAKAVDGLPRAVLYNASRHVAGVTVPVQERVIYADDLDRDYPARRKAKP